jgi:quercetin dioxygenase-like cupin family protein
VPLLGLRGGPIEVIRPGDRVFFEPGEGHWHDLRAAAALTLAAHLEKLSEEGRLPEDLA